MFYLMSHSTQDTLLNKTKSIQYFSYYIFQDTLIMVRRSSFLLFAMIGSFLWMALRTFSAKGRHVSWKPLAFTCIIAIRWLVTIFFILATCKYNKILKYLSYTKMTFNKVVVVFYKEKGNTQQFISILDILIRRQLGNFNKQFRMWTKCVD